MESVSTYPNISPLVAVRKPVEKPRESRKSFADVPATYLNALAITINLFSGGALTVAAAFTSQFVLMTTFWQGVALGTMIYTFFIIVGGFCGDV
jgi:hypothetical protein